MAKFDLATRKAQLDRIVQSRDALERTISVALVELLRDVMGKKKRLKVFDDENNDTIVFLNPSNDDTSAAHIEAIVQAGGVFTVIPLDPDGDDEREEVALHELPMDARINLFQFLLNK